MAVHGKKSFIRMIAVALLIVGMLLGQISESSGSKFDDCINKCYADCMKPNPGDADLSSKCIDNCEASCHHWIATARPLLR
ncbi:hypothetical protein MKW92_021297 [Papaver armeniacum]|nr:hypothetical protein MKW92_021297 [Papaver armeniacum]